MDFLRSGYKAKTRLWLNDASTVDIRWFRVSPQAKVFESESLFRSSVWDEYTIIRPAGETKGDPHQWDKGLNTLGYVGKEWCGPKSAIQFGGVHEIDPEIRTNADGTCDCCEVGNQVDSLGVGDSLKSIVMNCDIHWDGEVPNGFQGLPGPYDPIGDGDSPNGCESFFGIYDTNFALGPEFAAGLCLAPFIYPYGPLLLKAVFGDGDAPKGSQYGESLVTGEIKAFGGSTVPSGFLACDGAVYLQSSYVGLFAVIGLNFTPGGTPAGSFCVPDMQSRSPIGYGSGSGLSTYAIGDKVGVEGVQLTSGESGMPAHSHDERIPSNPAGGASIQVQALTGTGSAPVSIAVQTGVSGGTAASTAHENRHPVLCVNYIIAL